MLDQLWGCANLAAFSLVAMAAKGAPLPSCCCRNSEGICDSYYRVNGLWPHLRPSQTPVELPEFKLGATLHATGPSCMKSCETTSEVFGPMSCCLQGSVAGLLQQGSLRSLVCRH